MKTKTWIAFALLIVVIGLVFLLAQIIDLGDVLDPRSLRSAVRGTGALAPIIFILVMALARMFFIPGLPVVIAGGIIFGWLGGFALSLIGEIIGATGAFLFARHFGRAWVEKRLIRHREKLEHYDKQLEKHGIKAVIALRLFNPLPFTPFDVALGLSKVRLRQFVIGTLIGVTPGTLIASYVGEALLDWHAPRIIAGVALLLALAAAPFLYKRFLKKE